MWASLYPLVYLLPLLYVGCNCTGPEAGLAYDGWCEWLVRVRVAVRVRVGVEVGVRVRVPSGV